MLLYEQLMAHPERLPEPVRTDVRNAVVVRVDNVARYYYALGESKTWDWPRDFPNLAPPWPDAFYEWVLPTREGIRLGMYWAEACQPDGTWDMAAHYLIGGLYAPTLLGTYNFAVDPAGRAGFGDWYLPPGLGHLHDDPTVLDPMWDGMIGAIHVTAAAISFIHCKNTRVHENDPPPKLAAKQLARHGIPKVTYKTLEIQPLADALKPGGASRDGSAAPKSLHICRGHFADYRQGAGLFGKHHGLYWVDMHVRGKNTAGIVVKDYAVNPEPAHV